jgi:hypothetical protein
MKKKYFLLFLFLAAIFKNAGAQKIATFEFDLSKSSNGLEIPVSVNLDGITFAADSSLSLFEINGNNKISLPLQIRDGEQRMLYWIIKPGNKQKKKYTYQLINTAPEKFNEIAAENKDGALTIHSGNKNLLRYYFKTVYPPAGIDTNYKRSGFIHPLWAPHGQELTRIQPPDHYHHYGIWNPWTHVLFENDTVDFWNIGGKKGTVRFAKFSSVTNGPVFSEYEALHEHVVFKKDRNEKIALNELQTVRVYHPENNGDYYIVDFTSQLNCASDSPVLLMAYRYAGFGWRTTGFWNNDNCEVLTSEGKTRDNTDGTKARWCIVQGALPGNDSGGIAILSYPANYNHPEPMRIWVKNTNGRGDMFFNFAPTKDKDWLLEPGKTYVLRYRMVVFNGKFDAAKAESAWQYFAEPPKMKVKMNSEK